MRRGVTLTGDHSTGRPLHGPHADTGAVARCARGARLVYVDTFGYSVVSVQVLQLKAYYRYS